MNIRVSLWDVIACFSNALDLISPVVTDHHKRVAYIAYSIGAELNLPPERRQHLLLAGALHDSGAFSLEERLTSLNFEMSNPYRHAEQGYMLLRDFAPLAKAAEFIRYHHTRWDDPVNQEQGIPLDSHILHLADRIDVLIDMNRKKEVLGQVKRIRQTIKEQIGKMFMPLLVEVFENLAEKEYFWLDIVFDPLFSLSSKKDALLTFYMSLEELLGLSNIFRRIIDFRSHFTATHSAGVASVAQVLADFCDFPSDQGMMMKAAGYFHDLGKLAVPNVILEKTGSLTDDEWDIIKSHTFYTYRVLNVIEGFQEINQWASFHHERLDGTGYPFHRNAQTLSLGSRIMAVADVFTALIEDRPYRKGMDRNSTISILNHMAESKALDPEIVSLVVQHFDDIFWICHTSQQISQREYQRLIVI